MAVLMLWVRPTRRCGRVSYLERIITAVVLVTGQLHSVGQTSFHEYATNSLESLTIDLPDKSSLVLKEQSRVIVRRTNDALRVRVLTGEVALENVSSEPISVTAGDARIDAVATTLVINVASDRTSVTVTQGSASLSTLNPTNDNAKDSGPNEGRRVATQLPLRAGDHVQVIRVGADVLLRLES